MSSFTNTSSDALEYARQLLKKCGKCEAVVESTGNMWMKTYEEFESNGIDKSSLRIR